MWRAGVQAPAGPRALLGAMSGFPRRYLPLLHDLGTHVLGRRGASSAPTTLARDLLAGFFDVCTRAGQDGVLVAVAEAFGPLDISDASALCEEPRLKQALVTLLGDKARFNPGGPRNAMSMQLADCLLTALRLELHEVPSHAVTLNDERRKEIIAAIAGVVDVQLAAAQLRPAIIADARARCEERHLKSFDKITAQLDASGTRLPPQPKVPIDVVKAVQQALFAARTSIATRVANAALDRAKAVLEGESPELAARLEQPITHQLTPRDLAVRRATEVQGLAADQIVGSLLATLTELLELVWTAPAAAVHPYAVSQTFAVGDLIEHPKFGRGHVQAATVKNIEVEFPDRSYTLTHARGAK
jgi:hypothetical protein